LREYVFCLSVSFLLLIFGIFSGFHFIFATFLYMFIHPVWLLYIPPRKNSSIMPAKQPTCQHHAPKRTKMTEWCQHHCSILFEFHNLFEGFTPLYSCVYAYLSTAISCHFCDLVILIDIYLQFQCLWFYLPLLFLFPSLRIYMYC